jgi:hypothetical protein
MNARNIRLSVGQVAWLGLALALCAVLLVVGSGNSAQAGAAPKAVAPAASSPEAITCPAGQCFADVLPDSGFYDNINSLYMDGVISGYQCGGAGEPCDGDNRPYYRPGNNVTRQQMSKFVDLGRRNIADAIGSRLELTNPTDVALVISSTTTNSLDIHNASSEQAVKADCLTPDSNCWAYFSNVPTGDYAGVFIGGRGINAFSADDTFVGIRGESFGTNASGILGHSLGGGSYGLESDSDSYRSTYITRTNPLYFGLEVDAHPDEDNGSDVANFELGVHVVGNLTVEGSKSGYVVDAMQNADSAALEPGDVVVIAGSSAPVLGSIPVVMVKKADTAYDTGVVGVVDQALYVPDATTKAAYEKQENERRAAMSANAGAQSQPQIDANGNKTNPATVDVPPALISDSEGTVHVSQAATVPQGSYVNVVTLGAYKGIKVDASYGAIKAGDLLVSSPHAGYAMKAADRSLSGGATIGKALLDFDSGTGIIPVMVTLK